MLRKPSGRLCAPTRQGADARRAILGIPLQRSCLMHQVVFLASLRRSPPPSASPLLNWVRPYKCGGYKAETPSLPCAARRAAEHAASPQDRILDTHPDHDVALQAHTRQSGVTINSFPPMHGKNTLTNSKDIPCVPFLTPSHSIFFSF